ncbi:MAG: hypothetical protein IKM76_03945 [Prevotella sp.]|nr:hypothetical protein [Prevotella sp.]
MNKFTTIKTLLVGLCAMGAMSAWADATSIYERGTTNAWSDADVEAWAGTGTIAIDGGLKTGGGNEGYERAVSITTKDNSILVVTATWDTGSSTGRPGGYNYLAFGNVEFRAYGQEPKGTAVIGGVETQLTNSKDDVRGVIWTVTATINKATSEVSYSVTLPSGKKEGTGTLSSTTGFTSFKMGYVKPGRIASTYQTLKAIEITEEEQTVKTASYTVQFLCDGETIKDPETREGVVGSTISLPATDSQPIKVLDSDNNITNKYIYVSDDAASNSINEDGSTIITVNFREANKYNYSATNSLGDVLASGSGFEGETGDYYWAAVLNVDGTLYTAPAVGSQYKGSILLDEDNKEASVTYTASEDITTLVFLAEGEDIFTKATGSAADTRGSMGAGGYQSSAKSFVTLPAGKYKMVVSNRCTGERTGIHVFTAGTGANAPTIFAVDGFGYNQTWTSEEFTLTANTDLYFQGGSDNQWVDYLYIYKTGDVELPENVTVEVSDAGWATLFTDFALNFEGTGLTAYTATLSESTVTLTEVTSVTAGTGVVLKGDAKTYEIPVIDGSDTAKGDLKGNATTATEANGTQYVLMMNGSNAQFTKATSGSIAAGKAYLEKAESESRILNVVFAGEATGIKAIETAKADGNVYNMAGQRVAAPQKGLFIMNGKKVIIK